MAKILPAGSTVDLGFQEETAFDKLQDLLGTVGGIATGVAQIRQTREANNMQALNLADSLLQRAKSPQDVSFIKNTLDSTMDYNHVSNNSAYNMLDEYINFQVDKKERDFNDIEGQAGLWANKLLSTENEFGMNIMDMGGEELKKHYDKLNDKNGWLELLAKERVAFASYRDNLTELYGDKNPNFSVKYKDVNGNKTSMKLKDIHRMLGKYDNQMQALLFGALDDRDPITGDPILSREEAMTIATLTGEDAYGVSKFFEIKTEKLGYFQNLYDINSKTLNTQLNNIAKLVKDENKWGTLAKAVLAKEPNSIKNDMAAIVNRKDFVDNYPVNGVDMENKSVEQRMQQLLSDFENENIDQKDINLMFTTIGMSATDGRTMAKHGLDAWGGSNYYRFIESPGEVGDDIFGEETESAETDPNRLGWRASGADPDVLYPVSEETDPDVLYPVSKETDPDIVGDVRIASATEKINKAMQKYQEKLKTMDPDVQYPVSEEVGPDVLYPVSEEIKPIINTISQVIKEYENVNDSLKNVNNEYAIKWTGVDGRPAKYGATDSGIKAKDGGTFAAWPDKESMETSSKQVINEMLQDDAKGDVEQFISNYIGQPIDSPEVKSRLKKITGLTEPVTTVQDSIESVNKVEQDLNVKIDNPQQAVDSVNAVTQATQDVDDTGGSAGDWIIPASVLTAVAAGPKTVELAGKAKDVAVQYAHGVQKTAKYLNTALKINAGQINYFLNDDMVIKGMDSINKYDDEIKDLDKTIKKLMKGRTEASIKGSSRLRNMAKDLNKLKKNKDNVLNGIVNKYSKKWNISKQDVGRLFKKEKLDKWNIFRLRGQIRTKLSSLANKFILKPAQKVSSVYIPFTVGYNITEALGGKSETAKGIGGVATMGTAYRLYKIASTPTGRKALAKFAGKVGLKRIGTAAVAGGGVFSWATALIGAGWTIYDISDFVQGYQEAPEDTTKEIISE
jgi:hypothetical protein